MSSVASFQFSIPMWNKESRVNDCAIQIKLCFETTSAERRARLPLCR